MKTTVLGADAGEPTRLPRLRQRPPSAGAPDIQLRTHTTTSSDTHSRVPGGLGLMPRLGQAENEEITPSTYSSRNFVFPILGQIRLEKLSWSVCVYIHV